MVAGARTWSIAVDQSTCIEFEALVTPMAALRADGVLVGVKGHNACRDATRAEDVDMEVARAFLEYVYSSSMKFSFELAFAGNRQNGHDYLLPTSERIAEPGRLQKSCRSRD